MSVKLAAAMQGTVLRNADGTVLGVVCGHGWVANPDGSPTMCPVVNVIVPTDTANKMVVALPAELANVDLAKRGGVVAAE